MDSAEYGNLVSAVDATTFSDTMLPSDDTAEPTELSATGTALYQYKFEKRINGVPVKSTDVDLPIDRDELLQAAFTLNSSSKLALFQMAPGDTDQLDKYNALLKRASNAELVLEEETKHYDPNKGAFMVWVKYTELFYELNQRFNYIREDI